MTIEDYWEKEIKKASELAPSYLPAKGDLSPPDPDIVAALLIARQLRDIVTHLNTIEAQLSLIQQAIEE